MASVIQWLATGEESSLTRTPQLLPDANPEASTTPASIPTAVPTLTATPRPSPAPKAGTRKNPIPLGSSVSYPEWNVSVVGLAYDGLYRHPRVLQGGTAAGSLAFMVPSTEVSSLLLIVADGSLQGGDTTVGYFSLDASRG